jgi:hypothetical protein
MARPCLAFSVATDLPAADLRALIEDRVRALGGQIASVEHQRTAAAEHLDDRDQLLFDHLLTRLRAEVAWHHQLCAALFPDTSGDTREESLS